VFAQHISLLGAVEDDIVDCFKNGGGVPYAKFPRFHAVMAEDNGQSVLSSLQSHILPLVPELHDRLRRGIRMLEVGWGRCGVSRKHANTCATRGFNRPRRTVSTTTSRTTGT
jgi:hypothetical protein